LIIVCGITGLLFFDERSPGPEVIRAMTHAISHRGPDGEGFWIKKSMGLGHCRLSIIDLSDKGRQPMVERSAGVVITYNGEIYNYRTIRAELETLGHSFFSQTDTEVVLRSYLQWGNDCLHHFIGMFAFALWDTKKERLLLARDPAGIKPLFYFEASRLLIFGSEIKAVLASGMVDPHLNNKGVLDCCAFGAVISPNTLFANIKQLPPGHAMLAENGHLSIWRYHQPMLTSRTPRSDNDWIEEFESRLRNSVSSTMIADVPVGVLLSGGVDSTLIAAIMRSETAKDLKAFTLGFPQRGYDESSAAAKTARMYGMDHSVATVREENLPELLQKVIEHSEEGVINPSFVATWELSRVVSSHLKVVLAGDGADELMAGYETYPMSLIASQLRRFIPRPPLKMLAAVFEAMPGGFGKRSWADSIWRAFYGLSIDGDCRHGAWRTLIPREKIRNYFSHPDILKCLKDYNALETVYGTYLRNDQSQSDLQSLLSADLSLYLPHDGLVKMDRMGMANGLEIRVPFLNHDLIQFIMAMPDHLKFQGWGKGKIALRKVAKGLVSESILKARKMGFNAPADRWLNGPLRTFVLDTLTPHKLAESGFFNPKSVEKLIDRHMRGERNHAWELWLILFLTLWHKSFLGKERLFRVTPKR
jgi:asparagine synthase (glutamine-hydrolysing)